MTYPLTLRQIKVLAVALAALAVLWVVGLIDPILPFMLAGPVTLAQAKLNTTDALDLQVIDEFRKESWLLDQLTFDDSVNPSGGGATLTYGYTRILAERGAAFRAINAEYTPTEATKQRFTVDLKPLGGSYQIDRVLAQLGPGSPQVRAEIRFQQDQLIKGARAFFADQFINGDSAVDANGFDGLSKALAGTSQEVNAILSGENIDFTEVDSKGAALTLIRRLNTWLRQLDGPPDAILGNADGIAAFSALAAWADQYDRTADGFGRQIERFRGIPLVDLGAKAGSTTNVVGTYTGTNEKQRITITGTPTGGSFTLTVFGQTTGAIAFDASAAAVATALEALAIFADADIVTAGGALPGAAVDVTFTGEFAGANIPLMTAASSLTGGTSPAIAITVPTAGGGAAGTDETGFTDLYAVRFGLDGVHAVSINGPIVRTWLPDFTTAGAVKTGEAELGPIAPVIKRLRAAAVLRNVKVL